ncbi:uncharacterized protein [Phaseolus vulgaris]|uniref:uncharacterized protein isoform X2 n=1 Tax=Phaseolus vulgaris TaxID=3885 RepID=UPI0035CA3DCD
MESTHPIYEGPSLPTFHEQDTEHHVGESNPTSFSIEPTMNQPSPIQDSLTPDNESGNVVDQRPWLHAERGEFSPANGPFNVISRIIKQKYDEPSPTWKKVRLEVRDRWFGEFKSIGGIWNKTNSLDPFLIQKPPRIFKNAMSKVRHGQDKGTWIPQLVRATLDQHWSSTEFQNKSVIAKANRAVEKGASAYCGGSISTAAHFEKMTKELER